MKAMESVEKLKIHTAKYLAEDAVQKPQMPTSAQHRGQLEPPWMIMQCRTPGGQ